MMNASPVFGAKLEYSNFQEGGDLAVGKAEVPLPDDDPVAFEIILQILHHYISKIPFKVELPMLLRIAVLVDKYHMQETIGLYGK
jgi:hypothetical protein